MSLVFGVMVLIICFVSASKNIIAGAIDNVVYEANEKKRLQPIEYIHSKVYNLQRNIDVMHYIKSREHNEQIYAELGNDYEYIFGDGWRNDKRVLLLTEKNDGDVQKSGLHFEADRYAHTLILAHEGILSEATYRFDGARLPSVPVLDPGGRIRRSQVEHLRLWELVETYINNYHKEELIDFYVTFNEIPRVCNKVDINALQKHIVWEKLHKQDERRRVK